MTDTSSTELDESRQRRHPLGRMAYCASQIEYWAKQIEHCSIVIQKMPSYETNAEDGVKRAIKNLQSALAALESKRAPHE